MPGLRAGPDVVCESGAMNENPADLHTDPAPAADDGGTPSATVPGASVQPHGGQASPSQSTDGTYNDGNIDARGVMPAAGRPQVDPAGEDDVSHERSVDTVDTA